jgi:hypothetical protein
MENDILKDNVGNFLDASNALEEFIKNCSIEENKESFFLEVLKNINKNKNMLFKDLD